MSTKLIFISLGSVASLVCFFLSYYVYIKGKARKEDQTKENYSYLQWSAVPIVAGIGFLIMLITISSI